MKKINMLEEEDNFGAVIVVALFLAISGFFAFAVDFGIVAGLIAFIVIFVFVLMSYRVWRYLTRN